MYGVSFCWIGVVNAARKSGMHTGLIRRPVAGRMACIFAAALLACASSAQAQVIEENGFPVKGGDNTSESFSLSCLHRLVVRAGESVLFSCDATGVPEEGVRYEWQSASGGGLDFLVAPDELSPLFMAPVSGAGFEYVYRLTATGVGTYATASVTVSVESVPGASVGAPVTGEECDPFRIPDEPGAACAPWEREPDPFGFGSEEDFLFPEGPGQPDRPSGPVREGGFDNRTPPRLECPAAVFLEEMETGAIECHAWDTSGEEYIEYSWEPVGSTTRDYLDNPRLFPENSSNPWVIAPEAPAHETLESFRSQETTLRYRYRLTATSRATGLSSHEEVEVFVSSNRPNVYCPLEVEVEEGETISLDCEGADPLSFRMDYDEEGASVLWEWEGLWGTDTAPLAATDLPSPLFTAPAGSAGKEYHYIASMTSSASGASRAARRRVTVRVASKEGVGQAQASKTNAPSVTCEDAEVYEATEDFALDCSVEDEPEGATYAWTGRNLSLLTGTADSLARTFSVPDDIPGRIWLFADADVKKTYKYTVTMMSGGSDIANAEITVTVWEKPNIRCDGGHYDTLGILPTLYAGSSDYRLYSFLCRWTGAPEGSKYISEWTAANDTPDTDRLSSTTAVYPTFDVPEPHEIDGTTRYDYLQTISAENADGRTLFYNITVHPPEINVTCPGNPYEVDEGDDIALECRASGWPGDDPDYTWSWSPENNLTSYDTATPTFEAPDDVDRDTTYTYEVRASARHATAGTATVTVTVKDTTPVLACEDSEAFEGAGDITLNCSVKNEPEDASYSWAGRDGTQDTNLLTGTDTLAPTFAVPDDVASDETYRYAVTLSASGFDDLSADVTVTVRNKPAIAVTCSGNPYLVYEGEDNIVLDCKASNALDGSSYAYVWTGRNGTQVPGRLSSTTVDQPTFDVPGDGEVDDDETYEYRLTATAENSEDGFADVTVSVRNKATLSLTCEDPDPVYEGSPDFALDCTASGAPEGSVIAYAWTGRNGTQVPGRLSSATVEDPTFDVPRNIAADTDYKYTLTVSARGAADAFANVTATVKNKPEITVACSGNPYEAYEGSDDITLDCTATGASSDFAYEYSWTPRGSTTNTDKLSGAAVRNPTFAVPDEVNADETYRYTLTVSGENAVAGVARVTVRVRNKPEITVSCRGNPYEAYEGSDDITLNCAATGAFVSDFAYEYSWTPRGSTTNTDKLSSAAVRNPTFAVPDEVNGGETYEYALTVSAENAVDGVFRVTVRVLDRKPLNVACATPAPVYEGAPDFALDCAASGAPRGSVIAYAWTARGDTQDVSLLSATDIEDPTFYVPETVDADQTYEYLLTVSAENAEDAAAAVTVKVLEPGSIALICASPPLVYEGSEDFTLDCSISGDTGDTDYTYAWTASGDTQGASLLSATDISSPTFHVPARVDATTTYRYLVTASAEGVRDATADVAVTVLNKGALAVACADPDSVYEGAPDFAFACEASGSPAGSAYEYAWTARGDTQDTSLLSAADIASPTFHVPEDVDETAAYEYLLTVSAANADDGTAEVAVTVLNRGALAVACEDPGSVYEGAPDFAFDCEASGTPGNNPQYTYVWTARGDTQDTSLLSASDIASPTFDVPEDVDETTAYEYLLTVSAENAEPGSASVTVTVLNTGVLLVTCADPGSVYEGSPDIAFDCEAAGAPVGSTYNYVWTARGDTQDTSLLSAADIASPTFHVPEDVAATITYEYLLTVSVENAEDAIAEVAVTVLDKPALAVACANPGSVYEGSDDIAFDCEASGAPGNNPQYAYVWTARGDTPDTALLSAADIASPTFHVPEDVAATITYEYLLTVSAENAEDAMAEVAVTVLDKPALAVACANPGSVYEGSDDIAFDCEASGAPGNNPQYTYAWTARGDTQDTALLSAADIASPTFHVPEDVAATITYEYLLTVSAENAEDATAEVAVTVLDKPALAVACADPGSVYEGSDDVAFDCEASGAPGNNPQYTYVWTARGDTPDTSLLSATDVASPTFSVPEEVAATITYEYLLTVSAENAEDAAAEVAVTVLDRVETPEPDPVTPPVEEPPVDSLPALASSDPSSLGVTVSASPLRFGAQSADTQVSLDPVTDLLSTYVSGPRHAGRMTLSAGGAEFDENGEMDLSIEMLSPVLLKRADGAGGASIVLAPDWSYAESCEQLSSQTLGELYTEVTLTEEACLLLRFGGELDLTGVSSGYYAGTMDIVLRSGENEETFSVEVDVTVVPAQRVITIGPGGVRFDTSRELPAGLTEEQNLSIYPDVAFLTEERPAGSFELSNPSLVPLEVSVSARFGYTEATERGREVVVEDISESDLGDLSEAVDIYPGVLVLQPGEKGLIRYGVGTEALASMTERGYAAFFDVVSAPRRYADLDRMPEEITDDRTARVTMRIPGVYVPGEGASQLRATLLSVSYVDAFSATFLLETQDLPFAGEVAAYDAEGRELGRRATLVYTRSRVRIPLSRMPEEEAILLRFFPRGSDRVPEPATVPWYAPGRDIGDAGDGAGATPPATLARKP